MDLSPAGGLRAIKSTLGHTLVGLSVTATLGPGGSVTVTGIRFIFGHMGPSPAPELANLHARLRRVLDGQNVTLDDIKLDLSQCTDFQRKVLTVARRIPHGATVSYAALARLSGHPAAVRAVASVMRNNDFPLIVPCHRIVRSDGSIGGFMGETTGRSTDLKRRLLEAEGVRTELRHSVWMVAGLPTPALLTRGLR
jgi:O-6-methylguanine DNA methyltransferase